MAIFSVCLVVWEVISQSVCILLLVNLCGDYTLEAVLSCRIQFHSVTALCNDGTSLDKIFKTRLDLLVRLLNLMFVVFYIQLKFSH